MYPKVKRHKDLDCIKRIGSLPCVACGANPPNHAHHIKTRGSGGGDYPWNLMPLDFKCHTEVHQIGLKKFCEKYPRVKEYLELCEKLKENPS